MESVKKTALHTFLLFRPIILASSATMIVIFVISTTEATALFAQNQK